MLNTSFYLYPAAGAVIVNRALAVTAAGRRRHAGTTVVSGHRLPGAGFAAGTAARGETFQFASVIHRLGRAGTSTRRIIPYARLRLGILRLFAFSGLVTVAASAGAAAAVLKREQPHFFRRAVTRLSLFPRQLALG